MRRYVWFVVPTLGLVAGLVAFLLVKVGDTLVYYRTPAEVRAQTEPDPNARLRLGGQVQPGSVAATADGVSFVVVDESAWVPVDHRGSPPQLFQEGGGVVVEGTWDGTVFHSDVMIIKHDEQYRTEDGSVYTPPTDSP